MERERDTSFVTKKYLQHNLCKIERTQARLPQILRLSRF